MGDLNAKAGSDNLNFERVMGREGCGVQNDNGERLVEWCAFNNMIIGGTLFPHRNIHKLTWTSPNGRDQNQIDHLMVNSMWRRSLLDVRVRRGADASSDHHLVTAKVRLKLRAAGPNKQRIPRYDISRLQDQRTKNAFILQLRNRFQALSNIDEQGTDEEEDTVDQQWKQVKNIFDEASKTCLGIQKTRKKKEWITPDTWQAIEERRQLKKKIHDSKSARLREKYRAAYTETNRRVKRKIRTDKRAYMEDLAKEAEEAAQKGEQRNVYKVTKLICGKYNGNRNVPIRDKQGQLLTSEKDQEARWVEHFNEVLNRPPPEEEPVIPEAEEELSVDTGPPKKEEIIAAIISLKNHKAPGKDRLNAELFKADAMTTASILQPLFNTIWDRRKIPDDWNKGIIIKIPKKGALSDCNNWRGITLLSTPCKILAKVIMKRLSLAVDHRLREEQAGFRRGRGCIDHIFTLRNIIEQSTEWQRTLYVNFVDFTKAFDSVHRHSLWKLLRAYGIPSHLVEIIKSFYDNFTCCVGDGDILFEVHTGVRQGCVMSTFLFNLVVDWIMHRTTEDQVRGIRWTPFSYLEDLDYADDIALLSHTHTHIQEKTQRLNTFAKQFGLNISSKKTEIMALNATNTPQVQIDSEELHYTDRFTYLGSIIGRDGGTDLDIQSRLNKARNSLNMMNKVWRSSTYSTRTKLKLYHSCVLTTLLYGSECWRLTEKDLSKLSTFHTKSLRRILRIFWPNVISTKDLFEQCGTEPMATILMRRRWRWIGHVTRQDASITKTAMHWTPEGKRKRGRPKITWRRTVEKEIKEMGKTWEGIKFMAKDRQMWREHVAALHAS